ncbi:MAG TPA: nucleotidyl transferase AbiEii/AbiGii toxin family protein [bacterium]|nr:nucleotidyl transferase AbiEii/AbiGii toxin family protein [bacterium]
MRQYANPAAFRAAVDARLRRLARQQGVEAFVFRRRAALERLMVRLTKVAPGCWAFKGGLALETRLGEHARPSADLDADHAHGTAAARADIQRAVTEDLGDYFTFVITGAEELGEGGTSLAVRYELECSVGGVRFEPLQVDVSNAPPDPWDAEPVRRPGLLADVGLGPVDVLVVPLERQIAEKIHAYTRQYNGRTTRAKDLVDFVLIRNFEPVRAGPLQEAIERTFAHRRTHPVPDRLPAPPAELAVAYRREAQVVGITTSLEEAHRLAAQWLDPVLADTAVGTWDPSTAQWGR